ncbi:MAG: hypothetical protein JW709_10375 [Sedimentisphaerales bacterium]|nr:hypothetical protein [Sedimentisphaerales bacterium]
MLTLENLETRLLPAPLAPCELDLLPSGDSGVSNSDDLTNLEDCSLQILAERACTVTVYNGANPLGTAQPQDDICYYATTDTLVIDAECASVISYPMIVYTSYLYAYLTTIAVPDGYTTYNFYISVPGDYYVRANAYFPNVNQNSIFVNIDDQWQAGDTGPALWGTTYAAYNNVNATEEVDVAGDKTWHLDVGWHTLQFHGRETAVRVNRFAISTNPNANPTAASSSKLYHYNYTFSPGDLTGSADGVANVITATATNGTGTSPVSSPLIITFDSAATAPLAAPDMDAANDTGVLDNDDITSDDTPTFTGGAGSVSANAVVWLRVNGEDKRSVTANADGSYAIAAGSYDLTQGSNSIEVYNIDIAGNTSACSDVLTVTLDTNTYRPSPPVLDSASDSGIADNDYLTNVTTPTLTGQADSVEANATVWLRVGGANTRSTTANPDGSWSITLQEGDLDEGANAVDIYYVDPAGNISADSYDLSVTLDITPPAANIPDLQDTSDTGLNNTDNRTADATPTIDGVVEAGATVDINLNFASIIQVIANNNGYWSYTFAPGQVLEGENRIQTLVTDQAGNVSDLSPTLTIIFESPLSGGTSPTLTVNGQTPDASALLKTNNLTSGLSGVASANGLVQVVVTGVVVATAPVDADGNWTYSFDPDDLDEGYNIVEIIGIDPAGNTSYSAPLWLVVDTIGPVIQNVSPTGVVAESVRDMTFYLDDIDLDPATIINTQAFRLLASGGDGTFTDGNEINIPIDAVAMDTVVRSVRLIVAEPLSDESYQIAIDTTLGLHDQVGNGPQTTSAASSTEYLYDEGWLAYEFAVDLTPPAIPTGPQLVAEDDSGCANDDNITAVGNPRVTVLAEPDVTVEITCNGYSAGTAMEVSPGYYELTVDQTFVRQGENLLLAYAGDALGNTSEPSALTSFIYDNQAIAVNCLNLQEVYYNAGPAAIQVAFDGNDLDITSALIASNYRLLSAGSDKSFLEGNETVIDFEQISYNPLTNMIELSLPNVSYGVSGIAPDYYQLQIPADNTIVDLAGNGVPQSFTGEFIVASANMATSKQIVRNTHSLGHEVVVQLFGPGQAQIFWGDSVGSSYTIDTIILRNVTSQSRLVVSTPHANDIITVANIYCDSPLQSITAPTVSIMGRLTCVDEVSSIILGSVEDGAELQLTSYQGLRLTIKNAVNNAALNVDGRLQRLQTVAFSGSITADNIDSLLVTSGDLTADIAVTTGDLNNLNVLRGDCRGQINVAGDLKQCFIRGNLTSSTVNAAGNLGVISIFGDCLDNLLLAGQNIATSQQFDTAISTQTGGNIRFLRVGGSFQGSIAAANVSPGIDQIYLTEDDQANGFGSINHILFSFHSLVQTQASRSFGLTAATSLPSINFNGQLVHAPFQADQFHIVLLNS